MRVAFDSGVVFLSEMLIVIILRENVGNIFCFEAWDEKSFLITIYGRRVNVY